jgi:hypothetical protein
MGRPGQWARTIQVVERLTKVAQQAHIIAFHANTGRDENRPSYRFGVQLDALPQAHSMLLFRGALGVENDAVEALPAVAMVRGLCLAAVGDFRRLERLLDVLLRHGWVFVLEVPI